MNWARGYMEALQNAERTTLARNRIEEGANDSVLVQGPTGGGGSPLTRLYVDGVDADKVRLLCRLLDTEGEPTGEQFAVIVQSFGATAAENRLVDLTKPVVPPIVAGMWVLGAVINGDWECVSPPFFKAGEC